jgi:hypothetical protein
MDVKKILMWGGIAIVVLFIYRQLSGWLSSAQNMNVGGYQPVEYGTSYPAGVVYMGPQLVYSPNRWRGRKVWGNPSDGGGVVRY